MRSSSAIFSVTRAILEGVVSTQPDPSFSWVRNFPVFMQANWCSRLFFSALHHSLRSTKSSISAPVSAKHTTTVGAFDRCDVRHVYQYGLGAVHVEYLAAGALPETMRGLARSATCRLKSFASVPQRIFPCGPIPLVAPRLKISLGAL